MDYPVCCLYRPVILAQLSRIFTPAGTNTGKLTTKLQQMKEPDVTTYAKKYRVEGMPFERVAFSIL